MHNQPAALQSFIKVAPDSHFPIQNLPYGIFSPRQGGMPQVGVAIGEWVVSLAILEARGLFDGPHLHARSVFTQPSLNAFMALGAPAWHEARHTLQTLLRADNPTLRDNASLRERALYPMSAVRMHLPCDIGDYTDFYSSRQHASNVGTMFRGPENPLLPNWRHLPVAYHGRSSSIVVSGTPVRRPWGQMRAEGAEPTFAPTEELDFELECGFLIGMGNRLGQPIPVAQAAEYIFGMVLVNDWSARDVQRWEYRPLGPFLAKNFATTISPWVVPMAALAPFRCAGETQDPAPLPYLRTRGPQAYNIQLQVGLQSTHMAQPHDIAHSNARHLYWNVSQQLAHHTSGGCNVRPGDLLASGTISGPEPDSYGSLLELTWRGERPLSLPDGTTRRFLADGDRVVMTGWCQGDGYRVGFGELSGTILPAAPAQP